MSKFDVPIFGRGIEKEEDAKGFYRRMMMKLGDCGVKFPPNAKFLEVGSGSGAVLDYLKKKGFDIEGVDISPRGIGVKKANMQALPYDKDVFDCVISKQVFDGWLYTQEIEDQKKMLDEIARVLKKGGAYYAEESFFEPVEGLEQLRDRRGNQNSWVFKKP